VLSKLFTNAPSERIVRCYHCRREIIVPSAARTASCPVCFKGLVLDDLRVREGHASGRLSTCGRLVVERKGRAVTRAVEAAQGIEVHGTLEARVVSGGPVQINSGGHLKGECHATSLVVEQGAVMDRVFVRIGPDAFQAGVEAAEIKVKPLAPTGTLNPHAAPPRLKEIQAEMQAQMRGEARNEPARTTASGKPIVRAGSPPLVLAKAPTMAPTSKPAPTTVRNARA
jgi:cytoskeletal protein CcmA (bactofilin family)